MVEDKRRNQTKEFNGGLQTEEIASGAVACAGAPHWALVAIDDAVLPQPGKRRNGLLGFGSTEYDWSRAIANRQHLDRPTRLSASHYVHRSTMQTLRYTASW